MTYGVRVRKLRWESSAAAPKQLGVDLQLATVMTSAFIHTALTSVPDSGAFVVGWSGDHHSAGVSIRRFR